MTPLQKLLSPAALAAISLVPFTHNSLANDELTKPVVRGTLSGTVTLDGDVPEARRIDLSADPFCEEQSPNATTEFFVVNDGKVANVLVYVTNETLRTNDSFVSFADSAVIERNKCRFEPRVLGIQVGQPLEIVNRDKTAHNTHPYPKVNREWNMSQPESSTITQAFERPEVFISVRCNHHPYEQAYISVFNHPFFAVTDKHGKFMIGGLPPGSYKVIAMHEKLGEKSVEVAINGGTSQSVNFVYPAVEASKAR